MFFDLISINDRSVRTVVKSKISNHLVVPMKNSRKSKFKGYMAPVGLLKFIEQICHISSFLEIVKAHLVVNWKSSFHVWKAYILFIARRNLYDTSRNCGSL